MNDATRKTSLAIATFAMLFVADAGAANRPALNKPPVADFTDTVNWLTVDFTDASTDADGTIASHTWHFGDGSTSTAANPSHTFASAATYNVTETVRDNKGAASSKTVAVTALANTNRPPVAKFSYTLNGAVATFTDKSTDSDGTIVSHLWYFGDNTPPSTEANPVHTFPGGGDAGWTVTETVTDNAGASGMTTQGVFVGSGGPQFLLGDTGFESAGTWTASSGVICYPGASGCGGESAHAGSGFAWMGGYGSAHTDTLSQMTMGAPLPGSVALQFYLHVDTAETSTTAAIDKLSVAIYSKSGALLKTLATFSNLNKAAGYQVHSYDMSPWIGQQIMVKFTATEDASRQTSFVLDDVTMVDWP